MKVTIDIDARSVVRWILGLLLVWAAVSKLANLNEFYGNLLGYRLPLPDFFTQLIAIALPWLELLCGLMLLARWHARAALLWSAALFAVFVVATGQAWARGLNISCGCFDLSVIGIEPASSAAAAIGSPWFAFFRSLLLLAGAIFLLRRETVRTESPIEARA